MYELQKTLSHLNRLEELNKSKFNSSDFALLNKDFELTIKNLSINKNSFSIEDKKIVKDILSKIESLESKILPKADLIDSFSKSIT